MQAIGLLMSKGAAMLTGGAATGAAAAGSASFIQTLGTAASVGGAVLTGVAGYQSAKFQSQVAENNALIAEQNRQLAITESAIEAQRTDEEALKELGAMLADQSASGLLLSSGSHALRRKNLSELAARDRGNIIYEGEARGRRYAQQGQDFRTEAAGAKSRGRFALFEGALGVGNSFIGHAKASNERKIRSVVS